MVVNYFKKTLKKTRLNKLFLSSKSLFGTAFFSTLLVGLLYFMPIPQPEIRDASFQYNTNDGFFVVTYDRKLNVNNNLLETLVDYYFFNGQKELEKSREAIKKELWNDQTMVSQTIKFETYGNIVVASQDTFKNVVTNYHYSVEDTPFTYVLSGHLSLEEISSMIKAEDEFKHSFMSDLHYDKYFNDWLLLLSNNSDTIDLPDALVKNIEARTAFEEAYSYYLIKKKLFLANSDSLKPDTLFSGRLYFNSNGDIIKDFFK